MSLSHTCDSCGALIGHGRFLQMSLRLLRTEQGENQDALEEMYGDYCPACVLKGKAVDDLLKGFTRYPQKRMKAV